MSTFLRFNGAVRIRKYVVLAVIAVGGCGESPQIADTTALQGNWRIVEARGDPLPAECQLATFEIAPTTITMRSGTLAITTSYRAVPVGKGFTLKQLSLSHNGGQNCQGLSAEYVVSNYIQDIDVDLVDDRLRIYFPSREYSNYTDFVRADIDLNGVIDNSVSNAT